MLLFQPRLEVELAGWQLRGDVDLVRMERTADGTLRVFIGDMKSTVEVKVEHRLQVAFYRVMLEHILHPIESSILYRPPADPTPEDEEEITNSLFWKNLLLKTCSTLLWDGERDGRQVAVWGGTSEPQ